MKRALETTRFTAIWKEEERRAKEDACWDAVLDDERISEPSRPWDYLQLLAAAMRRSSAMLDIATAGGETLLKVRDFWPKVVKATEGYPPSLRRAQQTLAPLGVEVREAKMGEALPFPDCSFDLVSNRHAGLNPQELARVLKPKGTFLTQQVDGISDMDLAQSLGEYQPRFPDLTLAHLRSQAESFGFEIIRADEFEGKKVFADVSAVVFYMTKNAYILEQFSVEACLPQLLKLQERLETGEQLAFIDKHFILEIRDPR